MRFVILVLCMAIGLTSCKHSDEVLATHPDLLWKMANEAYTSENWVEAQLQFTKFKQFYSEDSRVAEARLKLADSYYHESKFLEGEIYYFHFIEMHPNHVKVSYARFQLAESQRQQLPGFVSRDLSLAKKAIDSYRTFLALSGTDPKLVEQANVHIRTLEHQLMTKHYDIGDWYFRRGHYLSAYLRFRDLLNTYIHLKDKAEKILILASVRLAESAMFLGDAEKVSHTYEQLEVLSSHKKVSHYRRMLDQWLHSAAHAPKG